MRDFVLPAVTTAQPMVIVMYQPDHFRVEDVPQMHALMRARPFAALVSAGPVGLYASHLPTVLKDEGPCGVIECHLARANPHCKDLGDVERSADDFSGARRLHHAELVSVQSATWQSRPDLELCRRPCLRTSRSDGGCGLAAPPCRRTHRAAGEGRGQAVGDVGCARNLYRRHAARHRRLSLRDHAARRQMEDESEPRDCRIAKAS